MKKNYPLELSHLQHDPIAEIRQMDKPELMTLLQRIGQIPQFDSGTQTFKITQDIQNQVYSQINFFNLVIFINRKSVWRDNPDDH